MWLLVVIMLFQQNPKQESCTNTKQKVDYLQLKLDSILMRLDTVRIDSL